MNNYGVVSGNSPEEKYNFENEVNYYDENYEECARCGDRNCLDNKKLCCHCSEVWE